ncbi:hypothetical protein TW95_gp0466 [Pandoravirus inopinatum]|uniref:Uncharacterized protein n=1 Tax=Pandoravirus inopinatum TaxID=1605721 RepID=A0A0B5J665_9VIRU|nr:hypothetical protein TW95_gp0466 [Pandoravirus inopinatum]AJF97200.1 hypothetical protein [Pandoravirus inopinatum]
MVCRATFGVRAFVAGRVHVPKGFFALVPTFRSRGWAPVEDRFCRHWVPSIAVSDCVCTDFVSRESKHCALPNQKEMSANRTKKRETGCGPFVLPHTGPMPTAVAKELRQKEK